MTVETGLCRGVTAFLAGDFERALGLLTPLADGGAADAQFRLAIMYQNGLGVVADAAQAFARMRAAAEQGHALAQHGLGFMYLQGECVSPDAALAALWLERAAAQGLKGSMTTLAALHVRGEAGPASDPERARALYRQAGFDPEPLLERIASGGPGSGSGPVASEPGPKS